MVAYRHFKAGGGGAPMYLPVQAAVSLAFCAFCAFCVCFFSSETKRFVLGGLLCVCVCVFFS